MCGRYTLSKLEQLLRQFPGILELPAELVGRFNIAPTQAVPVVADASPDRLQFMHWGLVPSWAKDPSIGSRMINARSETVAEKPAFRAALKRRRCLIPADGFYEWRKQADGKTKTPMYIRLKTGEPFAFAGLWETWHDPAGGELVSCTVLTTSPNALMESIHDRMPVILPSDAYAAWLSREENVDAVTPLLRPYPADEMEAYAVSRRVNSPRNDDSRLLEPAIVETFW